VLEQLAALGVPHRPYWIANMVWVRGGLPAVEAMAARDDVARVLANPWVRAELPQPAAAPAPAAPLLPEWGVQQIGAPIFWAEGITGQGVVVAGQDTGYDWDHPALIDKYRGWNGSTAVHDYNWHDAIHVPNASCPADSPEPCDDHSHGTHTMGTMVGDDGFANQIGVAPGARWIGCRNMNGGNGTPATYSECFQFFLAPTDLSGANPDPDLAPHVINNSWACPPVEGCTPAALQTVVENTRAAGIAVVVSAGNSGSDCSTVIYPPAIYDAAFSIGSTTMSDAISGFSSRGPVTIDGSNRMKPDVAAPGSGVRSSVPGGGYGNSSGTSMASPHVAGQVALLLAARPDLEGDVAAIEECIRATAVPLWNTQTCGGIPSGDVPNNVFGHGRVQLVWPVPATCESSLIFTDGFESGDVSAWSPAGP
jgi:subtilisin family serine protease